MIEERESGEKEKRERENEKRESRSWHIIGILHSPFYGSRISRDRDLPVRDYGLVRR
jgi:hypothetical protein